MLAIAAVPNSGTMFFDLGSLIFSACHGDARDLDSRCEHERQDEEREKGEEGDVGE
jgi:hypothetical protein